jgi:hypothetical protein
MSKSIIGDHSWAEMTDSQKIEAVVRGHASPKQMSEGLLDGSDQVRHACEEYLADTGSSFENLPLDPLETDNPQTANNEPVHSDFPRTTSTNTRAHNTLKQRFGLPDGFVPRLQRYGRSILIEKDIYRLPDGREFIVGLPTGTLGASRHLYALLTLEQYQRSARGSVYVRTDGKIFDYSVDKQIPLGEMFDTGYTIADLERTGRYAPELPCSKKSRSAKARQAAATR